MSCKYLRRCLLLLFMMAGNSKGLILGAPNIYQWMERNSYICDVFSSFESDNPVFVFEEEAELFQCQTMCGDPIETKKACARMRSQPDSDPSCFTIPEICIREYIHEFTSTSHNGFISNQVENEPKDDIETAQELTQNNLEPVDLAVFNEPVVSNNTEMMVETITEQFFEDTTTEEPSTTGSSTTTDSTTTTTSPSTTTSSMTISTTPLTTTSTTPSTTTSTTQQTTTTTSTTTASTTTTTIPSATTPEKPFSTTTSFTTTTTSAATTPTTTTTESPKTSSTSTTTRQPTTTSTTTMRPTTLSTTTTAKPSTSTTQSTTTTSTTTIPSTTTFTSTTTTPSTTTSTTTTSMPSTISRLAILSTTTTTRPNTFFPKTTTLKSTTATSTTVTTPSTTTATRPTTTSPSTTTMQLTTAPSTTSSTTVTTPLTTTTQKITSTSPITTTFQTTIPLNTIVTRERFATSNEKLSEFDSNTRIPPQPQQHLLQRNPSQNNEFSFNVITTTFSPSTTSARTTSTTSRFTTSRSTTNFATNANIFSRTKFVQQPQEGTNTFNRNPSQHSQFVFDQTKTTAFPQTTDVRNLSAFVSIFTTPRPTMTTKNQPITTSSRIVFTTTTTPRPSTTASTTKATTRLLSTITTRIVSTTTPPLRTSFTKLFPTFTPTFTTQKFNNLRTNQQTFQTVQQQAQRSQFSQQTNSTPRRELPTISTTVTPASTTFSTSSIRPIQRTTHPSISPRLVLSTAHAVDINALRTNVLQKLLKQRKIFPELIRDFPTTRSIAVSTPGENKLIVDKRLQKLDESLKRFRTATPFGFRRVSSIPPTQTSRITRSTSFMPTNSFGFRTTLMPNKFFSKQEFINQDIRKNNLTQEESATEIPNFIQTMRMKNIHDIDTLPKRIMGSDNDFTRSHTPLPITRTTTRATRATTNFADTLPLVVVDGEIFGDHFVFNEVPLPDLRDIFGLTSTTPFSTKAETNKKILKKKPKTKFFFRNRHSGEMVLAPNEDECVDGDPACDFWAKNGECKANPIYMLTVCRLSCHICTPFSS